MINASTTEYKTKCIYHTIAKAIKVARLPTMFMLVIVIVLYFGCFMHSRG